ncbi:hypothetical protein TNCV_4016281 [Trichonephila clavipes]|nr:hypothetical protein TNCV_4016281 [Trichonephila clavipes]
MFSSVSSSPPRSSRLNSQEVLVPVDNNGVCYTMTRLKVPLTDQYSRSICVSPLYRKALGWTTVAITVPATLIAIDIHLPSPLFGVVLSSKGLNCNRMESSQDSDESRSICSRMTIVYVCGEPIVNVSITAFTVQQHTALTTDVVLATTAFVTLHSNVIQIGLCNPQHTQLVCRNTIARVIERDISGEIHYFLENSRVPNSSTWSPKMMPTWLYHQDFAKFSLNRHYNEAKTRHRVSLVSAHVTTLEEDLKQQPLCQDSPKDVLSDSDL